MKFIRILAILCLLHFELIAQQDFDPGYIIKLNKDTLRGFIKIELESDLTNLIHFKNDEGSALKEYKAEELSGFCIQKDVYKSMRFMSGR
jgi:hypothetical protein